MEELSRYRVEKETDYLIVDTNLIGNTRVVANNSVFNISECYQGGSTLYDRGLNKQLDMVEVKNTLCVIEKELVLGINQYFLQDRKEGYAEIPNFIGDIIMNKVKDDVSNMIEIVFEGMSDNRTVEYSLTVALPMKKE